MNAACFMDNLNFSTCRFPQALEFWVEILNFSKTSSANIVCLAKPDFFSIQNKWECCLVSADQT